MLEFGSAVVGGCVDRGGRMAVACVCETGDDADGDFEEVRAMATAAPPNTTAKAMPTQSKGLTRPLRWIGTGAPMGRGADSRVVTVGGGTTAGDETVRELRGWLSVGTSTAWVAAVGATSALGGAATRVVLSERVVAVPQVAQNAVSGLTI